MSTNGAVMGAVAGAVTACVMVWLAKKGFKKREEDEAKWEAMLDTVMPAIVVIRVNYVKPFDGEQAGSAHATGFVVDAEKGVILTNRHVIGCGPVRAEATFSNKEEVALTPVYRDPVHDFGFFRYDPGAVEYAKSKIKPIELAPEAAKVGLEIRVVGNDAGEKVSILSGTLARLDRNAPFYHSEGYNDFNTFYYSAASNTSGGSSGSPVLDCCGRAVALNAGGSTHSSASYYLPLQGVCRALKALRDNEKPRRRTLRVVWRYLTCDEMRRLGLSSETERLLRSFKPDTESVGLLAVDQILSSQEKDQDNGPRTANKLDVGDVLVKVETRDFPDFDDLEATLDSLEAGSCAKLVIERGGKQSSIQAKVYDLDALNPREFVELGGGVLHPLSYCATRNGNLDDRSGLYVAFAGFVLDAAGVPCHSVLAALGEHKTPDLDALEKALIKLRDRDRVVARFYNIGDRYNDQVATVRLNVRWFPPRRWTRTDPTLKGLAHNPDSPNHGHAEACWTWRRLAVGPASTEPPPKCAATFQRSCGQEAANNIVSSLCKVSFDVVHAIDGVVDWHFAGAGLVVDADRGLVAVDRNTVVTSLGEATVTFAASVEIPAKIVFAHPTHNFALVQYDPARFRHLHNKKTDDDEKSGDQAAAVEEQEEEEEKKTPAEAPTTARLKPRELQVGDELTFVGLSRTNPDQPLSQRVRVTEMSAVNIAQAHVPRFRALNEEIAKFDQVINKSLGGVLVDSTGDAVATWSCYSFYSWNDEKNYESFHAVGVDALAEIVDRLSLRVHRGISTPQDNSPGGGDTPDLPLLYAVGFGLKRLPLSTARTAMKLDELWVDRLQRVRPRRSQVLSVAQLNHALEPREGGVREGDLILAVDGATTATFGDVETAVKDARKVQLTIWRDGAARTVSLKTEPVSPGPGTTRVVVWCGLLLQEPHRAVLEMGAPSTGVYASYYLYGSPASFYAIKACRFISQVDGTPVSTLDDFVNAVKHLRDGQSVRIKTSDLQGQQGASTLKTDFAFWPSHQFLFQDGEWRLADL